MSAAPTKVIETVDHITDQLAQLLQSVIAKTFPSISTIQLSSIVGSLSQIEEDGRIAFQVFGIAKLVPKADPKSKDMLVHANDIAVKLCSTLNDEKSHLLLKAEASKQFVNMYLSTSVLASVISLVLDGSYLAPRQSERNNEKVMIEYSQPNTHKAFHVGHMRNAALGDSLVRIYEACGHPVTAANYFGDEGAHIAKCLWQLQKHMKETKLDLKTVPVDTRAEWLGGFYSKAVDLLELSALTKFPFEHVVLARVADIMPHEKQASWKIVTLQIKSDTTNADALVTVVCGGHSYKVNDLVAYLPLGAPLKDGRVEKKDMKGVMSVGVIMSEKELDIETDDDVVETDTVATKDAAVAKDTAVVNNTAAAVAKDMKDTTKDSKDVKSQSKSQSKTTTDSKSKQPKPAKSTVKLSASAKIYVVPPSHQLDVKLLGQPLSEIGRLPNTDIDAKHTVIDEWKSRNKEVNDILLAMEAGGQTEIAKLWAETREWSMTEFKKIYKWLDCRFDHDFFESEVGDESKNLVLENVKKGVLETTSNGAVAANLKPFGLGYLILLKSNGAGLYATKDLELARRKFEQFKIDRSIYIVDAAQTQHFKQVFKVLELFGFKNATKCFHLPYGQVVLPSGKMSSRKGTMIYFSSLVSMLAKQIDADYLSKYKTQWTEDEINKARQAISVATIKFGMLNHDTAKDIVFKMEDWTAHSGMTGPYMMYAFARCQSILRDVKPSADAVVDYSLLSDKTERVTLALLWKFWPTVNACLLKNNPSSLCEYVYELAKAYSSWYEAVSVKNAANIHIQKTRLLFIHAFSVVLKYGLSLLGIKTIDRM